MKNALSHSKWQDRAFIWQRDAIGLHCASDVMCLRSTPTKTPMSLPRRTIPLPTALIWSAQVVVALGFIAGGVIKLVQPIPELAAMWAWTGDLPPAAVRLLGAIDLAGGAGVILPTLLRIKPGMTVLAALGCIALQASAMVFHAARGELADTPVNLVFLSLSAVIFWGRWKIAPVAARA